MKTESFVNTYHKLRYFIKKLGLESFLVEKQLLSPIEFSLWKKIRFSNNNSFYDEEMDDKEMDYEEDDEDLSDEGSGDEECLDDECSGGEKELNEDEQNNAKGFKEKVLDTSFLEELSELIEDHLNAKFGFTIDCFHLESDYANDGAVMYITLGIGCLSMSFADCNGITNVQTNMKKLPDLFKYMGLKYDETYTLNSTTAFQ